MPRLTVEERTAAIKMIENGDQIKDVAKFFKVSTLTISKLKKRFAETGSVLDRQRSGRPKKLDMTDESKITKMSKANPFFTARQVKNNTETSVPVSISTVKRILKKYGLSNRLNYLSQANCETIALEGNFLVTTITLKNTKT